MKVAKNDAVVVGEIIGTPVLDKKLGKRSFHFELWEKTNKLDPCEWIVVNR